ncbi:MAG: CADD family putative folate metabolism protein [Candidatus Binataceae bacterium]|jgi:pyrroloquinoline-quinone synthase
MRSRVIERLDSIIAGKTLLQHPFYQAWTAGELPIERLSSYAIRYYPHVAAFPRYLSALHSRCGDLQTRQALLENLIEEERGAENHPELWLRFAEALGVARDEVVSAEPVAAAQSLVSTYLDVTLKAPIAGGLAALYAYESQIPAVAKVKIEGLRQFYSIVDDRGLAFFRVHAKADVAHAKTVSELISRNCITSGDAEAAVDAAERSLAALWSMLDAV